MLDRCDNQLRHRPLLGHGGARFVATYSQLDLTFNGNTHNMTSYNSV